MPPKSHPPEPSASGSRVRRIVLAYAPLFVVLAMLPKSHPPEPSASGSRARRVVLACALLFVVLAMLPSILPALHLNLQPTAPQSSHGVTLMVAPRNPHAVYVPAVAQPIAPNQAPAALPTADAAREAATVATEDKRLRMVLHSASHVFKPEVVSTRGSLPTLVLTAASSAYTAQTLVEYGAMVMLPHNAALLMDNVYVSTNAKLSLGGPSMRTLYLDSGSGGFATIVGWGGNLAFAGTPAQPMTIMGWDRVNNSAAADQGYGRSYIREAGGKMTLTDVRASHLGFWSGRTGGIAWTGLTGSPSTGGAVDSTFTDDTYGSFVSRGSGVTFNSDLFEYNQLDGLHVHRYSVHTTATSSSAVRNGGNGFIVSPTSENTLLENDIAQHNGGNGFFLNGRPLATGASASGGSVTPSAGNVVEYSAALGNGKIGVLVEGGQNTVIKGDQACSSITAIEVKAGASDTVVTGNTISCAPRSGISVGPSAPGTVLSGNAVDGARTAFLIRNSGRVQFDKNLVTNATVFGVSARGVTSAVSGVGNTISGSGFRAIDSRADAPAPSLYGSNVSGWAYHAKVTFVSYFQFHPLAAMWLGIATLLLLAFLCKRFLRERRQGITHPYPASTRWRPGSTPVAAATASPQPEPFAAVRAANMAQQNGYHSGSAAVPAEYASPWQSAAFEAPGQAPARTATTSRGDSGGHPPQKTMLMPALDWDERPGDAHDPLSNRDRGAGWNWDQEAGCWKAGCWNWDQEAGCWNWDQEAGSR
jgi:hypothetical protein